VRKWRRRSMHRHAEEDINSFGGFLMEYINEKPNMRSFIKNE
jgi:hypothetical protein